MLKPPTVAYNWKCFKIPFQPGMYQPSSGQPSCLTCEEGFYCPGNSTKLLECPLYFYCPSGSPAGEHCLNGTYGNSSGLASPKQCASCPTGFYCVDGEVTGALDFCWTFKILSFQLIFCCIKKIFWFVASRFIVVAFVILIAFVFQHLARRAIGASVEAELRLLMDPILPLAGLVRSVIIARKAQSSHSNVTPVWWLALRVPARKATAVSVPKDLFAPTALFRYRAILDFIVLMASTWLLALVEHSRMSPAPKTAPSAPHVPPGTGALKKPLPTPYRIPVPWAIIALWVPGGTRQQTFPSSQFPVRLVRTATKWVAPACLTVLYVRRDFTVQTQLLFALTARTLPLQVRLVTTLVYGTD